MSNYFKIVILALNVITFAAGAPPHRTLYADENVQNFLTMYGYLPESSRETASLRTEDQLINAIKELQRFGGIPVTGEIDEETKRLMTARRCAVADIPNSRFSNNPKYIGEHRRHKRYTRHGQLWKHHNLTWSLRTMEPGGLSTGGVRAALSRALDLWARSSKLTFQEINSDSADILISFQRGDHDDGYAFDGRGQILAHAFFPGPDLGGDAHFDIEEIWLLDDETRDDGTSLYAVAAHEFGHSLGLAHSSEKGALMYPWYQGLSRNYELPDDDKYGIQQMYGSPTEKLWGRYDPSYTARPPTTARTTTTTTTTTTTQRPRHPRPSNHPNNYPYEPRYRPEYTPAKPDYRTHRTRRPDHTARPRYWTTPTPRKTDIPDQCDTSYDAITTIRTRELFIFKGRYFWRVDENGPLPGYPVEIIRFFDLPRDIDHVDAVYERPDKKIVFFIGKEFYVFNGNKREAGYPRPLTHLGLPAEIEKIDGAMIWGHNAQTYFFSGHLYWKYDEYERRIEPDYPRDMSIFAGVGYNIDAVFQWTNGKTYFFKGKGYWEFSDLRMRVLHEKQKPSAPFWMHCRNIDDGNDDDDSNLPKRERVISGVQRLPIFTLSGLLIPAIILLRLS